MKLLMITRKVDVSDSRAGFTYTWVRAMAALCEELYVVTWQESTADGLPNNVRLTSLRGTTSAKIFTLMKKVKEYAPVVDGIFCHMNPEYTVIAAPVAHWYKRRIVSWYTHRKVSFRRRIMELLADRIVTASPESFRRPFAPKKVFVLGHGIDTEQFSPAEKQGQRATFNILTVGRVAPSKRIDVMIEALNKLNDPSVVLDISGDAVLPEDVSYRKQLRSTANDAHVHFIGWAPHRDIAKLYRSADLFVNLSDTGSLDKAVLEAMACGIPVLTSNEAFRHIVPKDMFIENAKAAAVAQAIKRIQTLSPEERRKRGLELREIVVRDHGIKQLAERIVSQFT